MLAKAGNETRTNMNAVHAGVETRIPERHFSEIDLRRLLKEGRIEKDERGYFAYEREIDYISGKPVRGEKFYLEDSYAYMEDRMLGILLQMQQINPELTPASRLALEYELTMLSDLHRGYADLPEGVVMFSVRQIKEWIGDRRTPADLFQFCLEGGGSPEGYALRFMQEIETVFETQASLS